MRGFALAVLAALWPQAQPAATAWFCAGQGEAFLHRGVRQSASFSALARDRTASRAVAGRRDGCAAGVVSIGKELYDRKYGGDPSLKDLTWDGAGMLRRRRCSRAHRTRERRSRAYERYIEGLRRMRGRRIHWLASRGP